MQSFMFWKSWPKEYRWIFYGLMTILILSLIYFWTTYFQGASAIVHWEKIQEQKIIETTVHTFRLGPFTLSIPGENYVILEYFNGSAIHPNTLASYIFLTFFISGVIMLLTLLTTLDRFWFLVGMGLFIVLIVSLRLEVLSVMGMRNMIPSIVTMVVYIGFAYYFQSIRTATPFIIRLLVFYSITLLFGVIIFFLSGVYFPMLHLAVTAYTPALVSSIVFIFMIGHEILAWLLVLVSQGHGKVLRHFTIISVIYLFNIIVAALHEADVIHWNFIYINIFLLLTISTILGIWGFRERESLYVNILPFAPFGGYFIVTLAFICLITTAMLLGNHNDAAVKIVRDVTIFSHAGYGIIFFTYVFSNFILMMARGLPVHKIIYKPNRMPYFTFRFAGIIAVLAFVFYSNWRSYVYNGMAGFYNQLGDLYTLLDKSAIAEAYYEQGRNNGFQNNHSNYALGTMKSSRYDFEDALVNYDLANGKRPTEYSLINEGNVNVWMQNLHKGLAAYKKGTEKIKNSGPLKNNLGFGFGKTHNLDSALYYLNEARSYDLSRPSAEANFFALAAIDYIPIKADSIFKSFNTDYTATLTNALALATSQGQDIEISFDPLRVKKLNLYSATLLNNYLVRHTKDLDTTFIENVFNIANDSINEDFSEALKASLAPAYYHHGNVRRAIALMAEQAFTSQSYQGKYNYIIGLWVLEQGNAELAARYFDYATVADYKEAPLYKAIALTEDGQLNKALAAWNALAYKDTLNTLMVDKITTLLTISPQKALALPESEKYQFCRYRLHAGDTLFFDVMVSSMKSPNYKALTLLEMAQLQFDWDNRKKAIEYLNAINGLEIGNEKLYTEINAMELLILAEQRDIKSLSQKINDITRLGADRFLEKTLVRALIAESKSDTVEATRLYEILANYNSYFEPGLIAAADYFRKHGTDKMKPYTILVEALQVNDTSPKLIHAYIKEALRMGFDEYAVSAMGRLQELQAKWRSGQ